MFQVDCSVHVVSSVVPCCKIDCLTQTRFLFCQALFSPVQYSFVFFGSVFHSVEYWSYYLGGQSNVSSRLFCSLPCCSFAFGDIVIRVSWIVLWWHLVLGSSNSHPRFSDPFLLIFFCSVYLLTSDFWSLKSFYYYIWYYLDDPYHVALWISLKLLPNSIFCLGRILQIDSFWLGVWGTV